MDGLILVTGGAGFIGSHLVDALLTAGHDVRVLDDFSTGKAGEPARRRGAGGRARRPLSAHRRRRARRAQDARRRGRLRRRVPSRRGGLGARSRVADPVGTGSVTHGGTVNAVRMAVDAEVPRFVLASSCAVYGDAAQLPVAETSPPRPLSPYAEAKLAAEQTCAAAADAGQLTAVCLRFFNVYGPRQDPGSEYSGVISRFMTAAAAGEPVTEYGDGEQTRDFVYVGDVVRGHLAGAAAAARRRLVAQCGLRHADSVLDVLGPPGGTGGRPIERRFARARRRHQRLARRRRARRAGCSAGRPAAASPSGLAETWAWYREQATPGAESTVPSARRIMVGAVPVGGGAPVAVQSMTCTRTGDAQATLAQVRALVAAGCEIVRVSLPTAEEAPAFARVVREAPAPIIADIHYDWRLALAAIEAGAAGIRINPGTMAEKHVREIVRAAAEARVPRRPGTTAVPVAIRIGVNAGSLPRDLREQPRASRPRRSWRPRCAGRRGSTTGASAPTSCASRARACR